jgi:hypothetical protein
VHLTPAAASGTRGVALVELYAGTTIGSSRLSNVSARARTAAGADTLIAGFVVDAGTTRTVLLRVLGPGLAQFGVTGTVSDSQLTLFRGNTRVAANNDWNRDSGVTAAAFAQLGAFDLPPGSKDAALLVNLAAGSYTVHATSADGTSGVALIEIYEVE